jgi:hypothetical protein
VNEAHNDARRRICQGFDDDLSPFRDPANNPAANYPSLLHRVTLQGYFGEVLAGLAIEHWGAHGHMDWAVPAFLFRLHYQEFQHLDSINQRLTAGEAYDPDVDAERRPGRTGDDCIAFRMNVDNVITHVLTLEAKCIGRNNNNTIQEAHEKLATGPSRPSSIIELINLLEDYDTPEAQKWQQALLNLWKEGFRATSRYDAVAYACGQIPRRPANRMSWMPTESPHPAYNVNRRLEGLEFQFEDLQTVIDVIYRGN